MKINVLTADVYNKIAAGGGGGRADFVLKKSVGNGKEAGATGNNN